MLAAEGAEQGGSPEDRSSFLHSPAAAAAQEGMAEPMPPPAVPSLPLGPVAKEPSTVGNMDPPLQPPPGKRPSLSAAAMAAAAAASVTSTPTPSAPSSPRATRMMGSPIATPRRQHMGTPATPQRLLTPRVSWSEMVSRSQESVDAPSPGSPGTPAFHLRVRSPHMAKSTKRRRPPSDGEDSPLNCRDQNEGRLEREFCDVTVIGRGQFSTVYRARNCIDQAVYAVKKTTQISRRGPLRTQLREVFALANVSMEAENCPNIVRYFSSWFEDGRLHIQTELCECSLRDRLTQRKRQAREDPSVARFSTQEVVHVVRDVSNGLKVLHGCNFVHLDIKPDNILLSRNPREQGCHKIADLGLAVAALDSGCDDISEGDCRYLAKEVLRGDFSDLPKADIFALGLVCCELATNPKDMPCNGEAWHRLRDGGLDVDDLAPLAAALVELLVRMVHAMPAERPAAKAIYAHPLIAPENGPEALHEKVRQQEVETERARRLADSYFQEILHFKRQELLGSSAGRGDLCGDVREEPGRLAAKDADGAGLRGHCSSAALAAALGGSRLVRADCNGSRRGVKRGRTVG